MDGERIAIVGGGILGVALAHRLTLEIGAQVTVLEKEPVVASHQTGRNSNVVHAGLYYTPGSEKAVLCRRGRALLEAFCVRRNLPYVRCGKVVVALNDRETAALRGILRHAHSNGVSDARLVGRRELGELEPHVRGVHALHSPSTAITDYAAVTRALATEAIAQGAKFATATYVSEVSCQPHRATLRAGGKTEQFDRIVLCAGLHSDRIARSAGFPAEPRVVPFRGEYYAVLDSARGLVRSLVYPVPDPRYPFLGVHLTPKSTARY